MTELDALLILNALPGIRPLDLKKLLDHFGSAARILTLKEPVLGELIQQQFLTNKVLANIQDFPKDSYLKKEYNLVRKKDIHLVTFQDAEYPGRLKEIPDPPSVLYVKGNIQVLNMPGVAMVGSRRASVYGLSMAERFAIGLAEAGLTVISGMAWGIDTASHRGALKAGGVTFAVLGCGLNHVYPKENERLAQEISQSGALISEFPMDTPPLSRNFPRRNRLISGLAEGVIVVEAAQKSGALITSDFALDQGREVFAVPGKVDQPTAQGVNRLIKEGAKMVTCIEDVLEELKIPLKSFLREKRGAASTAVAKERCLAATAPPVLPLASPEGLSPEEKRIYQRLHEEPVHIDTLAELCDLSIPRLTAALLRLELKNIIKPLPGKMFVRCE